MIDWRENFLISLVTHALDHLPIILHAQSSRKLLYKGQRSFKFEEAWLLFNDYEDVIKATWEKGGTEPSGLGLVK